MDIKVYGKVGCGLCESAVDKLERMGFAYEKLTLSDYTEYHEGWREDNSVAVLAKYTEIQTMPIITIDGHPMKYSEAMKLLKGVQK